MKHSLYLCINKKEIKQHFKTNNTMTTLEIRMIAFRVIDNVIRLKSNVKNGCFADAPALEVEMKRIPAIKAWAIANDQIAEIRHYFASNNFGQNSQFVASEISKMFN